MDPKKRETPTDETPVHGVTPDSGGNATDGIPHGLHEEEATGVAHQRPPER